MAITTHHAKTHEIPAESSTGVAPRSAPRRYHFTNKRVAALPAPMRRTYHYDDEVRGLGIALFPSGKKNFVLYRKVVGKPERIMLGAFGDDLTVEQARNLARENNAEIAKGKNPAARRRAVRDEMTLRELFDSFLLLYAKKNKRTWQDDEGMFTLHLQRWGLRRISTITRLDVIKLHTHIGNTRGKYAANRVVELLCSMFNRAISDWGWTGTNPAAKIKAFKERKRQRFLDGGELSAFFQSLAEEANETIRDYVLVSLLTGARRSNVQEMRWDEINWRNATWTIPAEKAKGSEPINVVLSPVVTQILQARKASILAKQAEMRAKLNGTGASSAAGSGWVFPGHGKTGHLVEPKTAWARILKRGRQIEQQEWLKANPDKTEQDFRQEKPVPALTDLRLHDLRRTLGSWQAATGASLPIIGKSLGHESLEATKVYARLNLDPVRESVQRATQAMLLAGGLQPSGLLEGK